MKKPYSYNVFAILTALLLAGCAGDNIKHGAPMDRQDQKRRNFGSLLEDGWLTWGGNAKSKSSDAPTANPFLWRAGLESLSFMPLASADIRGGIVVSDWYSFHDKPNDLFKIQLYIKSPELKAEGIQVTVYRKSGINGKVIKDDVKAHEIENIILQKARSLYIVQKKS